MATKTTKQVPSTVTMTSKELRSLKTYLNRGLDFGLRKHWRTFQNRDRLISADELYQFTKELVLVKGELKRAPFTNSPDLKVSITSDMVGKTMGDILRESAPTSRDLLLTEKRSVAALQLFRKFAQAADTVYIAEAELERLDVAGAKRRLTRLQAHLQRAQQKEPEVKARLEKARKDRDSLSRQIKAAIAKVQG